MKKRTAVTDDGVEYRIFEREPVGTAACPGAAHENPYIDNCGLCAPEWGTIPVYKPVTDLVEVCRKGLAVPADYVEYEDGERAERTGAVKLVSMTERRRVNFLAYVETK